MEQQYINQAGMNAGVNIYEQGIQYRYDAFISYRHTYPDTLIAEKLSAALETYRVPAALVARGFPARLAKVFRDKDELPTSSNLGRDIEQALIASRYLIVICSPRTVESVWVEKEVSMFVSLGRKDRILTLLIEGEPNQSFPKLLMNSNMHSMQPNPNLPASLSAMGAEPLAADIRSGNIRKSLNLLNTEKLRLIAPIIGCTFDDLKQRDRERQARKRVTVLTTVLALVSSLVVYSTLMWKNAEDQRALAMEAKNEAEEARIEAEKARVDAEEARFEAEQQRAAALAERDRALISQSLSLSQQVEMLIDKGDRMLAMTAALYALPRDISNPDRPFVHRAELALYKSIYYRILQGRSILHHESVVRSARFSPDGTLAVTAAADNLACVWNAVTGKLLHTLAGHTDTVQSAVFSTNGKWIATVSDDATAIIWDSGTGEAVHVLQGHTAAVSCGVFSPDSKLLATSSTDGSVILWDVQTGASLMFFGDSEYVVLNCCFSPDGTLLAATGSLGVRNVETGAKLYHLDNVFAVSFSTDGSLLAVGYGDGRTEVLDALSGSIVYELQPHAGAINHIAFSPDGLLLATASEDKTACVWDSASGELLETFNHEGPVSYLSFWVDAGFLATCSWTKATIWDTYSGEVINTFNHNYYVNTAEFDPTGGYLITASDDFSAHIWDLFMCDTARFLNDHDYWVNGIRYGPNKDVFLTFSQDGSVIVLDAGTKDYVAILDDYTAPVTDVIFSPDGSMIAVVASEGPVRVYDTYSGELICSLEGHWGQVNGAAFSPDGKRIATCSADETVMIWNPYTGANLETLIGYESNVISVLFGSQNQIIAVTDLYQVMANDANYDPLYTVNAHSLDIQMACMSPDGTKLLTCSADGTARLIDAVTGEQLGMVEKEGKAITSARFSPGGEYILTTCNRVLEVWDTDTCSLVKQMVYGVEDELLMDSEMSSDNRRIITISQNNEAAVWDFASGEQIMALDLHLGQVFDATFGPDNGEIITASADCSAIVWSVFPDIQSLIDYARGIIGDRELTEYEMEKLLIR